VRAKRCIGGVPPVHLDAELTASLKTLEGRNTGDTFGGI